MADATSKIRVTYQSIDHVRVTRSYKTIERARQFAQSQVGRYPDLGSYYAISDDGVGKITVRGASLEELFPGDEPTEAQIEAAQEAALEEARQQEREFNREMAARWDAEHAIPVRARDPRCTCTDEQLDRVGCDCLACFPF